MKKNILILAAHPDDEVLGCGGAIAKYSSEGYFIHVAFLADGVFSRRGDKNEQIAELESRRSSAEKALKILGVSSVSFNDFPDNRMDTIPIIDITQAIELLILSHSPQIIFTHHPGDVNIDHQRVYEATVVATRPQPGNSVETILCYEVVSSTEWQLPISGKSFNPNYFIDISGKFLDKKIKSLKEYEHEMRSWPHPRSIKGVECLAHWRGASVGLDSAEAFMVGRIIK
tara:strand:+ start:8721 stop:9407 length:687 start_codon:yes stop_codon:yes gene_type:complete